MVAGMQDEEVHPDRVVLVITIGKYQLYKINKHWNIYSFYLVSPTLARSVLSLSRMLP